MTAVTTLLGSSRREDAKQGASTGDGNRSCQGHTGTLDFDTHSRHSSNAHRAYVPHQVPAGLWGLSREQAGWAPCPQGVDVSPAGPSEHADLTKIVSGGDKCAGGSMEDRVGGRPRGRLILTRMLSEGSKQGALQLELKLGIRKQPSEEPAS